MADSLKFGTSGLRGLAVDLIALPSARYAAAFLEFLRQSGSPDGEVLVGRDLRASSPEIAATVVATIGGAGFRPVDCGELSTPALALAAQQAVGAIMVTGSHIPADRNGLKYYRGGAEIAKADEAGILAALRPDPPPSDAAAAIARPAARQAYLDRYLTAFPAGLLSGWRIGVYQHSSVMRDDLVELVEGLGGVAVALGRADHFVPIDTEAVSAEVAEQARKWSREYRLDTILSTDGDADRPLLADETGTFLRGDLLGMLTAAFLGADAVVTPVTSNSMIEGMGFAGVIRTKVGSPFVIAGIEEAVGEGRRKVIGFEANGGVLLGSAATIEGRPLTPLPTRDAVLPMLSVLAAARARRLSLSELAATLPPRIARSDRLEHVPQERTAALLASMATPAMATAFFAEAGPVASMSDIDGLRFVLTSGDVIHYRASGNAPEMRCYTEAATIERADELLRWGLAAAEKRVR